MTTTMKIHPLAELFPELSPDELQQMAASIKENGLRMPIVLLDSEVIDGRNRLAACKLAGVKPTFVNLPEGADPLQYVLDANLHRRHLTAGQLGALADQIATWRLGQNQHTATAQEGSSAEPPTLEQAAARVGASVATTKRVRRVRESGQADLFAAVKSGAMSASAAEQEAIKRTAAPATAQMVGTKVMATSTFIEPTRPAASTANPSEPINSRLASEVLALRKENDRLAAELAKARADIEKQIEKRVNAYIAEHLEKDARVALRAAKAIHPSRFPLTRQELNHLKMAAHPDTAGQLAVCQRALDILLAKEANLVAPELSVWVTKRPVYAPMPDKIDVEAAEAARAEEAALRRAARKVQKEMTQ